jgi:phosphoadenosine phosphosulfate reductase
VDKEQIQIKVRHWNDTLSGMTAREAIAFFIREFEGRIGLSTSLGAEDQVITQMIAGLNRDAYIFTLDTGRLFQETYDLIDVTEKRYKVKIRVFFPDAALVEEMVNTKGVNLFFESMENRKFCCHIRKIEPLKRALAPLDAWISGIRRNQAVTRKKVSLVEWDELNQIVKINPLVDWSEDELWDYIRENNIPYNALHDKGFPSIGCMPCTRAVEPGEDVRAGRWWWELPEFRECGLHKR